MSAEHHLTSPFEHQVDTSIVSCALATAQRSCQAIGLASGLPVGELLGHRLLV